MTEQNWRKWDLTSTQLHAIEWRARHMKTMAGELQEILNSMKERPAFETEAQNRLKTLTQDIAVLHAFMKASTEFYHRLPETA